LISKTITATVTAGRQDKPTLILCLPLGPYLQYSKDLWQLVLSVLATQEAEIRGIAV
jgi:hypothetical protein